MFHTILTLSYLIPAVYLFIRMWQLFIDRRHLWIYILVFALLFSVYPLSNFLEDRNQNMGEFTEKLSNYILPFFLYVFLLVLATDILMLLTSITRLFQPGKFRLVVSNYRFLIALLSCSLVIVIAGIINFNTIRTSTYKIELTADSGRKVKIIFVSDFHLEEDVAVRFVEKFAEKVRKLNPDLLLYGGDIVEGSGENIEVFENLLGAIKPTYGSYGVLGNHDRIRDFGNNFFTRSGITLLRDSIVVIDSMLVIAGRNDSRNSRIDASDILEGIPDLPLIMLDHRPTDYDRIRLTDTDLVLSGHTHRGQLFPVNLYINSLYELSYGYIKKNNTHFIVSSGIRLWGPRVRTVGKTEIVVVELTF